LKLEATVVLAPAEIPVLPPATHRPLARSRADGHGLADAVRSLNEGAELLAETRRGGLLAARPDPLQK
jgi:hypothetical protein